MLSAQIDSDNTLRIYIDQHKLYHGINDSISGSVSLHGGAYINSTALTNSFVKQFLFQGHVSESAKNDVSVKVKDFNRIGYDINLGITGTYQKDNLTYVAGINYRNNFNSRFTRDLFEVMFRGNKNYADKNAILTSSSINYFSYQNIHIGVSKELSQRPVIIGGGISLINGTQYQNIDIKKGDIYTAIDGSYIDVNADFKISNSKNKHPNAPFGNGIGAGVNLNFTTWTEKSRLNVNVKDLGFIYWKNLISTKVDSSIRYEGLEISNILDYKGYSFSGFNEDTIKKQYHVYDVEENQNKAIPFTISANYNCIIYKNIDLFLGAKYIAFANYYPQVNLKSIIHFKNNLLIMPGLNLGGYGKFNFELGLLKSFKNEIIISGNVMCLEYLLYPLIARD